MTEVAYEYDAINLSQGFPSFTPPKALTDRLSEVTHGGPNQYAISYGAANFREALTQKVNRFTKMDFDPDENVVVCNGCTEALLVALSSSTPATRTMCPISGWQELSPSLSSSHRLRSASRKRSWIVPAQTLP